MNKKLLAVAVGAALTGAPMLANAAATVYGAAHLSVDSLYRSNTANNHVTTLSSNSSFIGFKAEDDIGGGVKGIVGAEWQVGFDTGATGMANRNVFAGLQGGFGTVRLGQIDDIVKNVGRKVDFFHSEQIGENRSLTSGNSMDARIANGVRYDSPKLGPVTLSAHYGLANSADQAGAADATIWVLGAEVAMGGLYIGGAFKDTDADLGTSKESTRAYRVSASYGFGFGLTVGGLYQMFHNPNAGADWKVFGGGASMKVGNGVIKGQYYRADQTDDTNVNGATLAAVGYDHNLSKNTMVYAVYGVVRNQATGVFTIISAGHDNPTADNGIGAAAGGDHSSGLSAGLKVKF